MLLEKLIIICGINFFYYGQPMFGYIYQNHTIRKNILTKEDKKKILDKIDELDKQLERSRPRK